MTVNLSALSTRLGRILIFVFLLFATLTPLALANGGSTIIYVDADASGSNDGTSWANAFTHLQDALDLTNANGSTAYEIWVAEGIYYPDEESIGTDHTDNSTTEFFTLSYNNVQLYGGFFGGETQRSQRDWTKNITILSGDVTQNDTNTDGNNIAETHNDIIGSNSEGILRLDGQTNEPITAATVIDGFIITAGKATGSPNVEGGGLYCAGSGSGNECSPTLVNLIFSGNVANSGGGIYNNGSSFGASNPSLVNVTFNGNNANNGGGIYNYGGSSGASNPSLVNVTFSGNSAINGGGIANYGTNSGTSSPSLINVSFSGNSASTNGGGVYNNGFNGTSHLSLTNVILWGNTTSGGGPQLYNFSVSTTTLRYSLVQGSGGSSSWDSALGTDGGNNLDADPLFVDAANGDLRLQAGSPAIDAGDSAALPADAFDLDGDSDTGEAIPYDLTSETRLHNGGVDIGAYEALYNAPNIIDDSITFLSKWGSNGSGDGQFNRPGDVAIDANGDIYVVDASNNRVQKFDSVGNFITKWGSSGSGDGQFNYPFGIAVDASGHVYVADYGNNRVQKFDGDGNFITKWGSYGSGDGQFRSTSKVAVDANGDIYVADYQNGRIQKFDSNGNFLTKWGSSGSGDGQFSLPNGIAIDAGGNIYVADANNDRVQKFDSNGNFLTKWGSTGNGDDQFRSPGGLAVDASGHVYVGDNSHRVKKFDSNGNFITKWGGGGSGDGQFNVPAGLVVDASGNMYVADNNNHRIQKFSLFTILSNVDVTMSEDGNPTPFNLTLNATDADNDTLTWSISSPASNGSAVASGIGITKTIGYTPTANYNGNDSFIVAVSDGSLTDTVTVSVTVEAVNDAPRQVESEWKQVGNAGFSAGQASNPSLALDSNGTPYVAYLDGANSYKASVMKWNGSAWVQVGLAGFSAGQANYPSVAVDSSGTPYLAYMDMANSNKVSVMKFDGSSWVQVGSAGFSAGQAYYISLALDSSDTLYVAYRDFSNSSKVSVMKFDGSSWVQVGLAGFSAGTADYTSLAVDSSGTPYVAYKDVANSSKVSVMKFDGSSWVQVGNAGFSAGTADYTSLAVDSSGTPYVAYMDVANSSKASVMKFDGSSWVQVGSAGFSAGTAFPVSLDIDSSGTPYLAYKDGGNSSKASVMKWGGSAWVPVVSTGFSAGPAYSPSLALDSSGTPYLAYQDAANGNKASVMQIADKDLVQANVTMSEDGSPTPFDLTLNATDLEGDTLTWSIHTPAGYGTAIASGTGITKTIGYTPTANYNGSDSFVVQVSDGSLTDMVTVNVTVENTPDAPVITEGDSVPVTMSEDGDPTPFDLTLNATDADNDTLTWSISSPASNGSAVASGIGITKTIGYTPTANYHGNDSFIVAVSDGGLTDTVTVSVTVEAVNDSPQTIDDTVTYLAQWGNQGSGDGQFENIYNIATDTNGNIYVVDYNNDRIQKFDSHGNYLTQWGSEGSGDGQFNGPIAIAVDANGNVYVSDGSSRIQKFTSSGTFLTKWGSNGTGDGEFKLPQGIDIDTNGHVYVVDNNNHRIQKFDSNGTYLAQWGSAGSGNGQFNYPSDLAIDMNDNIYVVDNNNRVQKFDSNGSFLTKWGVAGSGNGQFWIPSSIAIDASGSVYVSDSYRRVQKFDSNGTFITKWGSRGVGDGQFEKIMGLAIDSKWNIYVADYDQHRIQKFSLGEPITDIAVTMSEDGTPTPFDLTLAAVDVDGDPITWSILSQPSHGIAFASGLGVNKVIGYTPTTHYYGFDSFIVQISDGSLSSTTLVSVTVESVNDAPVTADDTATTLEDTPVTISVLANDSDPVEGSPLTAQTSNWPTHGSISLSGTTQIVYTPHPNYYGTDTFTYWANDGSHQTKGYVTVTVQAVNDAPQVLQAGDQLTHLFDWGGPGSGDGELGNPFDVAVDSNGNLYVADTWNLRIQKFDRNGTFLTKWGTPGVGNGQFQFPTSIAIDSNDKVYVTDLLNNNVQKFDNDGTYLSQWGSPGSGDGQFNGPSGLAIDSLDNVYVAESGNQRMQKFDSNGNFITKWGGPGNGDGQFAHHGMHVLGVAADSNNNIYVVDAGNHRVQKFSSDGTLLDKWGANGGDGSSGGGNGEFGDPKGIAIDAADNVYVSDYDYIRIQKFDSNGTYLTHVDGEELPGGLAISPDGRYIYLTELNSSIIQVFTTLSSISHTTVTMSEDGNPTPFDLTLDATDAEDDPITWSLHSQASHGTAVVAGTGVTQTLSYNPVANYNGSDSFEIKVADGQGGESTVTINVMIEPINDLPLANSDVVTTTEGVAITIDVLANDSDVDGPSNLSIDDAYAASHGTTVISNNQIIYTPNADIHGSDRFYYQISDGTNTDSAEVNVTIIAQNDAPQITEGESITVTMSEDSDPTPFSLILNATDIDDDPVQPHCKGQNCTPSIDTLTWTIDSQANHGVADIGRNPSRAIPGTNVSQTIVYTPNLHYNGDDSFVVKVADGNGGFDTITVNVIIEPINDAPTAQNDRQLVVKNHSTILNPLSNDSDPDEDLLTITVVGTLDQGGSVNIVNNHLSYSPATDFIGTESFSYTISDGHSGTAHLPLAGSNTATVTLVVVEGNEGVTSDLTNGGTLTYTDTAQTGSLSVTIQIPSGQFDASAALVYTVVPTGSHTTPAGLIPASAFNLQVYLNTILQADFTFTQPLTLTIEYDEADLAHIPEGENGLHLLAWNGSEWVDSGITLISHNTETNQITFQLNEAMEFGLFGRANPAIRYVYLPQIATKAIPAEPDLVVDSIDISGGNISLTIRNIGTGPATDAFWVDLYFNPTATPEINQEWDTLAPAGAVWGITKAALNPNETLTLTLNDVYYFPSRSSSTGFPANATIYAQVDSINYNTTYGNVLESDESNNVGGPVVGTVTPNLAPPKANPVPSDSGLSTR